MKKEREDSNHSAKEGGWHENGSVQTYTRKIKTTELACNSEKIDEIRMEYNTARDSIAVKNIKNKKVCDTIEIGYIRVRDRCSHKKYVKMLMKQIYSVLHGSTVQEIPVDSEEESGEKSESEEETDHCTGSTGSSDNSTRDDRKSASQYQPAYDIADTPIVQNETYIRFRYEQENVRAMKCDSMRIGYLCRRCEHLHVKLIGEGVRADIQKNTHTIIPCDKCTIHIKIETKIHLIVVEGMNKQNLMRIHTVGMKNLTVRDMALNCLCDICGNILQIGTNQKHRCTCGYTMYVRPSATEPYKEVVPVPIIQKKGNTDITEMLKNNGTCKHYKKSTRIFIFPCCNSRYPCDICHDEKEDHKSVMAHRMICGRCGIESGVTKVCHNKECKSNLVKTHTQFWEGGSGTRNKATMSKNDKRKYRKK